jgi:MFS family permease
VADGTSEAGRDPVEGGDAPVRGFRGWWVVFGTFSVLCLVYGCAYSFPAFFDALQAEFNASRGEVSAVFGLSGLLFFTVGALSGPIADRIDPRWVVGFGVTLTGIGLVLGSLATELWQVLVAYGLCVGVGIGCAYVPSVGPVQRWFVRRRGMASGMAVAGIGVGTLAVPPIATAIIAETDWRTAYMSMGIATIVLGLLATRLIIGSPEAIDQHADGDPAPPPLPGGGKRAIPGLTLRALVRTRPFVFLWLSSLLLAFGLYLPFVHLVPYAMDRGVEKPTAVLLIMLIGAGSIAGRFLMSGLADRLGRRPSLIAMFFGLAVMFVFWWLVEDFWLLAVFAVVFGIFYGGYVALAPAVLIDYIGPRSAAAAIGALYTSVALGTGVGPTLAGYAFDWSGSYSLVLAIAAALTFLAALATLALEDPEKWRARVQAA